MKHRSVTIFIGFVLVSGLLLTLNGCTKENKTDKTVITIRGSDTMVNLTQRWAEVYMDKNSGVSIHVTGGGSGTGIAALLQGSVDIANASRNLKDKEIEKAEDKDIQIQKFIVALDGIAVIVHPENTLDTLTVDELKNIFTGKIKNFSRLGGIDEHISLYGRENSSGTYEFFKNHVLSGDDFDVSTQVLQGTGALSESVARDKSGIAYGGVGYFAHRDDVKILYIKKDENSPAISPVTEGSVNYQAVWNDEYFVSRNLYMIIGHEPSGEVKNFIDFVISPEGQKIVEEMEYIPLRKYADETVDSTVN